MDPHERKVRAIYEALKAKNWKGAMKLANGALQKYKNSAVIQSFKALALEKLGKTEEAFQMCEEIRSVGTVDEQVLHTMGIIYKALDRMECLTEAYVKAVEIKKNDFELMEGLFSCYVREGAFSKQQQLAMRMYKAAAQSEKYLWWVVVSVVLQVWKRPSTDSVPPLGVDKTLKLAQSMIGKQLNTKKTLHSFEALMLYVDLLYTQGMSDEVLQLLQSDMAATLCKQSIELKLLLAQCYFCRRDLEGADRSLREILIREPEDWTSLCLLLDLYLPLNKNKDVGAYGPSWKSLCRETCQLEENVQSNELSPQSWPESANLERAEEALNFIREKLQGDGEDAESPAVERTKALAEVEFIYRKTRNELCAIHDLTDAICDAFRKIGHLKSTPIDLQHYILSLDYAMQTHLSCTLLKEIEALQHVSQGADQDIDKNTANALSVGYQVLSMMSVNAWSDADTSALIQSCMELCAWDASIGHADVTDSAISAAVNLLLRERTPESVLTEMGIPVWKAFVLLGLTANRDTCGPDLKIAFASVSFLLGAPGLAQEILAQLDIKHLQLDSVSSHLLFPYLRCYCHDEGLRKYTLAAWNLFSSQLADVEDMTFAAYTQGTYTKILEFVAFKERLKMSHAFHTMQSESCLTDIKTAASKLDSLPSLLQESCEKCPLEKASSDFFNRLSFNEDLRTRPRWLPPVCGDHGLSVAEWWHGIKPHCLPWTESWHPQNKEWRQSRISWMKIRWSVPHLLKRMWLMEKGNECQPAFEILFKETGTNLNDVAEFLQEKLTDWKESEDKLQKLHEVYRYFQCSIFLSGHSAHVLFLGSASEDESNQFRSSIDLMCDFCEQIITVPCQQLESDLSCWIKTASVTLGTLLSEDLFFVTTALQFWRKQRENLTLENPETFESTLQVLTGRIKSVLEGVLHYLKLMEAMEMQKVVHNIMLLLGVMKEKPDKKCFKEDILDKDLTALSQFMETLNMDDYERCAEWEFYPAAEMDAIEALLMRVFAENKEWTKQLIRMANNLLNSLTTADDAAVA